MEENTKQQQLLFNKGITNVPSDALCDDNALETCNDMVFKDSELQPIQTPTRIGGDDDADKVLFFHQIGSTVNNYIALYNDYIGYFTLSSDGTAAYQDKITDITSADKEVLQIEAVGKTLVVKMVSGLHYFLWTGSGYKSLGQTVPTPTLTFNTTCEPIRTGQDVDGVIRPVETVHLRRSDNDITKVSALSAATSQDSSVYEDFRNRVVGKYEFLRNKMRGEGVFTDPFVVRYAVKLYDGSYIHRSAPILVFPTVTRNCFLDFGMIASPSLQILVGNTCRMYLHGSDLKFMANYDYSDWEDIVQGVSIFMSDFVDVTRTDQTLSFNIDFTTQKLVADGGPLADWVSDGDYDALINNTENRYLDVFQLRTEDDIMDRLVHPSAFYELVALNDLTRSDTTWVNMREEGLIKENRLMTIVNQLTLEDGYMEQHTNIPTDMMVYNGRLITSNIMTYLYDGYDYFMSFNGRNRDYTVSAIYTEITSDDGTRIVKKSVATNMTLDVAVRYFFYPDTRAKKVTFVCTDNSMVTYGLKEHPTLTGAYIINALPNQTITPTMTTGTLPTETTDPIVSANQLFVSEVNNPWTFGASGNLTAGLGEIIGVATTTQALSQGQFGQYPLIIFSSDGIFAASMNDSGEFTAVHPMSREVCNNAKSITQTDGEIYFSSEKGLMRISGNSVVCVSEKLHSEFPTFLKSAEIAYDYRDSLLWIMHIVDDGSVGTECWVYSIKTGTFQKSTYFDVGGETNNTILPFDGVIYVGQRRAMPQNIIEGYYSRHNLIDYVQGSITPHLASLKSYGTQIIFNADDNKFYEKRALQYKTSPSAGIETYIAYFSTFNNSSYYRDANGYPLTDCIYRDADGTNYYWDGTALKKKFLRFDRKGSYSNIISGAFNESNLLSDLATVGYSNVSSIYNYGLYIAYDETQKRFYEYCGGSYVNTSSVRTSFYVCYTDFDESDEYMDSNNVPYSDVWYIYEDIFDNQWHKWSAAQQELVQYETLFYGFFDVPDNLLYADQTALETALDAAGVTGYTISETIIVFDQSAGRFRQEVSVYVSGEGLRGTFYLRELPSTYYGEPADGNYYFNTDSTDGEVYVWDNGSLSLIPTYLFSSMESSIDNIYTGTYNNNYSNVESDIIEEEHLVVLMESFDVTEGGIILFDTGNGGSFVHKVEYTYTYQGKSYSGTAFYTLFTSGDYTHEDYNDINAGYVYQNGSQYYMFVDGVFTLVLAGISGIVNAYPDTLFHVKGGGLYSLINRPHPADDETLYSGEFMTRPMKFENALALKTICQIRNIRQMEGSFSLTIYASNNMSDWMQLKSLRGKSWKYYKFKFTFSNMKATDRFSGTVLITQERRVQKLR